MSLYNTYNNEDIISRAIIAGMLDVLNNGITYNQVWSNEEIEEVDVPWFYNQSGDERFMQDFYTHYADCNFPKPVDGNFDRIPRGILTYTGSTIDANRITNRFVQGRYVKEVDGKLQSFVSFLYSIPLTVNFECELWLDTQVTALKVEQAIRETFYKTKTFYVYYKGMRLGATSGFSEDDTLDKMIEYSFENGDTSRPKLKFNIEVETYQPVFDPTTEMDANNYMRGVGYRIYGKKDNGDIELNDGTIELTSPATQTVIPKGFPLLIEWSYNKELFILNKVDAYWILNGDNEWNIIEKGISNHEFWYWNIPDTFTNFKQPTITYEEDPSIITVYREPVIAILPDTNTKLITASSFYIINEGYFMASSVDTSIGIILEMKSDSGQTSYTQDNQIFLNINHYKIDSINPVWVSPDASIIFPGTVDYKVIDLHIANNVNSDVFGVVRELKII
jgi:hypothetical protein